MKKLFIFLLATLLASVFTPRPLLAAAGAGIYLSSATQNYQVGETIYIKVRVNPEGFPINVVRSIINFQTGLVDLTDHRLDGAWLYPSPGSFADGASGVVNQGGFLLSQSVSAESQFMTIELKAMAQGSVTFTVDPDSLLVDTSMVNRLTTSVLQPYTIHIGPASAVETPSDAQPPIQTQQNRPPVINDLGEVIGVMGEKVSFIVTATDPDGDNISLSAKELPQGATFDTQSGEFSWIPSVQNIYFATFTATDDSPLGALSSDKKVRITIFCSGIGGDQSQLTCPANGELSETVCPVCQNESRVFAQISQIRRDPQISSPSHPEQDKWYASDLVNLRWSSDSAALGYSMTFDHQENGEPNSAYFDLLQPQITYKEVPTGTWFFHLKIRYEDGWSKTYHYKVKVDTNHPRIIISDVQGAQNSAKLNFSARDIGSGVLSYDYRIDKGEWKETISPLDLANFSKESILSLRAKDYAGNASEVNISLSTFKQEGDIVQYILFPPPQLENPAPTIDNLVTRKIVRNLINSHILIFTGTAEPYSSVLLVFNEDERVFASASADSRGRWQIVFEKKLKTGSHTVFATSIKDNLVSPKSKPLTFTLDDEISAEDFSWGAFLLGILLILSIQTIFSVIRHYSKPS